MTSPPPGHGSTAGEILRAVRFAADRHRDQRRKGSDASPYVNHPIEVAELLTSVGGVADLVTLQAALLHDTLEDTATTPAELEAAFGAEVRRVVEEVTDDKRLPKAARKAIQVERAPGLSLRARQVKLADKIANVRSVIRTPPRDWTTARRREYVEWTACVARGLRGCNPPLERLYAEVLGAARRTLE